MKTLCVMSAFLVFVLFFAIFLRKAKYPSREFHGDLSENVLADNRKASVGATEIPHRSKGPLDFSEPRRILLETEGLPDHVKRALAVVSSISERLHWKEDEAVEITETDTVIIIVWPSRHEGTGARHADYEARAVIDKQTFAVVSLKRGS